MLYQESDERVEIHPGLHVKRFLHQYSVSNRGWIPAKVDTISITINTHIPSLLVELVTVQYSGHKDYQRCLANTSSSNGTMTDSKERQLTFSCPPMLLLEDESLTIEANFLIKNLNSSLFSDETHDAGVRSTLAVSWQGGEGGVKSCTSQLSPYHPTLGHQILQSWDLILAITIGLILIIITGLAFQKLGVFSRVRIYRGQLEAMAITRTEATPSAFDYDNMDVGDAFVNDHGPLDEGDYVDELYATKNYEKNVIELEPDGAVFHKLLEESGDTSSITT
jgi:hypothetical protein